MADQDLVVARDIDEVCDCVAAGDIFYEDSSSNLGR